MSHIMEFTLNKESANEGDIRAMAEQVRRPDPNGPSLPLGAVIIMPSEIDLRLDEAGARALIGRKAGVDMDVLARVVRRLRMIDKCLRDPGNDVWIAACAKDHGYADFEDPKSKRMVKGAYLLYKQLNEISEHEVAHKDDKVKEFYTVSETLHMQRSKLEGLENLVCAYLTKVAELTPAALDGVDPESFTAGVRTKVAHSSRRRFACADADAAAAAAVASTVGCSDCDHMCH